MGAESHFNTIRPDCPNCGESYYMDGCGSTTLVYYQPIWKDGKNINPDRNTTTFERGCLACGKRYSIQRDYEFYKITELESPPPITDSLTIFSSGDMVKLNEVKCDILKSEEE